jgi:hypothetical protein
LHHHIKKEVGIKNFFFIIVSLLEKNDDEESTESTGVGIGHPPNHSAIVIAECYVLGQDTGPGGLLGTEGLTFAARLGILLASASLVETAEARCTLQLMAGTAGEQTPTAPSPQTLHSSGTWGWRAFYSTKPPAATF